VGNSVRVKSAGILVKCGMTLDVDRYVIGLVLWSNDGGGIMDCRVS